MPLPRRLDSLTVKNYRSLADVTMTFEDLTVLIGPNGGGKSNILDVLRFVRDALTQGLPNAVLLNNRGGMSWIRRKQASGGRLPDVTISLDMTIDGQKAVYSFTLGSVGSADFSIKAESFRRGDHWFTVEKKTFDGNIKSVPHPAPQERNLLLPLVSGLDEIAPVAHFLTNMGVYTLLPNTLREPQTPTTTTPLSDRGDNLASILQGSHARLQQITEDLTSILNPKAELNERGEFTSPVEVQVVPSGSRLVVRVRRGKAFFELEQESDGTVRALALLVALYQQPPLALVAIEEPELFIYPRALSAISEICKAVSEQTQVLLTSHSPDILTYIGPQNLRLVRSQQGRTYVQPVQQHNIEAVQEELFTTGDLLRIGALADD